MRDLAVLLAYAAGKLPGICGIAGVIAGIKAKRPYTVALVALVASSADLIGARVMMSNKFSDLPPINVGIFIGGILAACLVGYPIYMFRQWRGRIAKGQMNKIDKAA